MMTVLRPYLALIKFRYHITFVNVIFGALLFAPVVGLPLVGRLLLLYLSFNVLLYGGIYTLNDLVDRDSDRQHPLKRLRPVAAGDVSERAAVAFGLGLIALGLITGLLLFSQTVLVCYLAVVFINAGYSWTGRNLRYVDIVLNSLPHPVRFLMGVLLVDRFPPAEHLIALTLLAFALSCLRRHVEREFAGWESRRTLFGYSARQLEALGFGCLAALALLCARNATAAPAFHSVVFSAGVVLVCGGYWTALVRKPLRAVWIR